jgi:serine protease Do
LTGSVRVLPLLLVAIAVPASAGGDQLEALRACMLEAKDRVFPALVHIINVEEGFRRGRREKTLSSGSGFFIDAKGRILTNYHVAGQASRLFVTLPSRRRIDARLIAGDPYTDLALLEVDPAQAFTDGKVPFARFGDSDALEEGDFVMAMGSPLSLSRSVSFGIVSCRARALDTARIAGHETGKYNTWIQTDAAINPGNSGGPLVNLSGEVVGVNTRANLAADNIGFAIPSNVARDVVAALLEHKRVPRSWLGLRLQALDSLEDTVFADSSEEGVLVAGVAPASPAAVAAVQPGDFIVELNGEPFHARFGEELPGLYRRIAGLPRDADATLDLLRAGTPVRVRVRAAALGRDVGREMEVKPWGLTVRGITARMVRDLSLEDARGVMVTGIRVGGASGGKLEAGDVIRRVGDEDVTDLDQFLRLVRESAIRKDRIVRLMFRTRGVLDVTVLRPWRDGE